MGEPYVVTIHDMSRLLFDAGSGLRMQARRFLLRRGLLRARRIMAVSEATRRDVHQVLGIPADRIRLIYNAPNPDFFRPAADQKARGRILERYQIDYPFLLYAGNIRPQKNIPAPRGSLRGGPRAALAPPGLPRPAPHHHRRRDLPLSLRTPRRDPNPRGKGRSLPGLRPVRSSARLFRERRAVRLPVAL